MKKIMSNKNSIINIMLLIVFVSFSGITQAYNGDGTGNSIGKNAGTGTGIGADEYIIDTNNNDYPDAHEDFDGDGILNKDDEDYQKPAVMDRDHDGDGILNKDDEDYISPKDGTGIQTGNGKKTSIGNGSGTKDGFGMKLGVSGTIEKMKIMNQDSNSSFGKKISEFAHKYEIKNNKALEYEEKIQSRSAFSRFFMGGDRETANQLKEQVGINNEEIIKLKEELVNATEEEIQIIEEQILNLQQDCDRLEEVAEKEGNKKGLFRWW